ncbi:MAG TPA: PIG-L family deacetylase, partial [Blastocatellia bacterium]|nr:PIG-L family deacetylase [Blastocatellia bacterium]
MNNSKLRVLVVAAHPDDELLGCGGTIALHTKSGDQVTFAILCEGESLRYG